MSYNPAKYDEETLLLTAGDADEGQNFQLVGVAVVACRECGALVFDRERHDQVDCGAPLGDGK